MNGSVRCGFTDPLAVVGPKIRKSIEVLSCYGFKFANAISDTHFAKPAFDDQVAILSCSITKSGMPTSPGFRKSLTDFCAPNTDLDVYHQLYSQLIWNMNTQSSKRKLDHEIESIENPLLLFNRFPFQFCLPAGSTF